MSYRCHIPLPPCQQRCQNPLTVQRCTACSGCQAGWADSAHAMLQTQTQRLAAQVAVCSQSGQMPQLQGKLQILQASHALNSDHWHLLHGVLTVHSRHTCAFSCTPCHQSCRLPDGAHQHSCFIAATACLLSASKLEHVDSIAWSSLHMLPVSPMHGSAATGTVTQGHC